MGIFQILFIHFSNTIYKIANYNFLGNSLAICIKIWNMYTLDPAISLLGIHSFFFSLGIHSKVTIGHMQKYVRLKCILMISNAVVYVTEKNWKQPKWWLTKPSLTKGLHLWLRWWSICLQCRRPGFNPWVGKILWKRKWQPSQYSCLENPMDRGAWWVKLVMKLSLGQLVLSHDRKKKDLYIRFERYS